LAGTGITPVFPIWGRPTAALAREMISAGMIAHLVCVDLKKLSQTFAGRRFDEAMLADLLPGIDPCGENGEFHTFVLAVTVGETIERDGFANADLMLA
jgi:diphthamide synthase (EF-2-diphthine--ammonia ligase)